MTVDLKKYYSFLESKIKLAESSGFEIAENKLNKKLFDFQKFVVKWSLKLGKAAIFADCGLGKTFMQLEWAKHVNRYINKPVLILCPLAVSGQTISEGKKFGIKVERIGNKITNGIYISNYEQLDNIDCSLFGGIVLDESSILKNYTGKYKTAILELFKDTPFKLACTATPSPNDHLELGNHSEFLNIMPSNEMISRWFINDTMNFGSYRLKKHGEMDFWEWVSTWAMCISKPSDIGFKDDGFILPKLNLIEQPVQTELSDVENGMLIKYNSVNATNFNQELRNSKTERLNRVIEIVNSSKENWIVWIKQNEEAEYLMKHLTGAVEVSGSDKPEVKEYNLLGFAENKFRVLVTKSKIAQFGMNYQNCHNQIFASLDFSFESLYQSIRRSYRFGQKKEVNIHLVTTYTMGNVLSSIKEKQRKFYDMQSKMSKAISNTYLNNYANIKLKINYEMKEVKTNDYHIINGDSCEEIKKFEDNSIDFSIFSPPFSNLYIYSDSIRDMGNSKDDNEFFEQFKYLIADLKRVMRPGRLIAVHCKNLVNYMNTNGMSGQRDFRGDIIRAFTEKGMSFHSEVVIWKDPVIEMQRTKAHGLLYKQLRNDSSFTRQGMAEYLVIFRKWADENNEHLQKPIDWKTNENFNLELWQKWASPVWMDIRQTNVLNVKEARDNADEKHICPLQLDVIERAVYLWSNPGDTVFSPFAGIGSEGYMSIKCGRKFKGIELKESYFNQMKANIEIPLMQNLQLSFV